MTVRACLMRVHRLLASPERWTKGARGRDGRGRIIDPRSPQAERRCLYGALVAADAKPLMARLARIIRARHPGPHDPNPVWTILGFNDATSTDFADIQAVLAAARDLARAQER